MVQKTITSFAQKAVSLSIVLIFFVTIGVGPGYAFNIGEEREVGEKLLYSVRSAFKLIDDPDITQYVTKLGDSVLEVAGIQYFDYHFFVIDNKEFNAFAAPSGLIFFHSGLISTMNSEDEFVSVLGHEIGHIVKRHLAARIEKGTYSSIASLGLALAAVAFGGAATPVLLSGALATGQSLNLHFSREHEEEADLLAYDWMKSLQRSPKGQAKMLESMRRIARYRSDKLPQYLLTHPNPEARLNTIQSLLEAAPNTNEKFSQVADEFAFLRFKYRVLSQVSDPQSFRANLASTFSNPRSTNLQKTMATFGLSQIAKNENDYNQCLELLGKVVEEYPDRTILKVDIGSAALSAGLMGRAEKNLRDALGLDSSDMYATFNLAKLLNKTGRQKEAKEYFGRVVYTMPEYSKVYFELGQIASTEQKAGEANYYLGKYYLYEGKLKLSKFNFNSALRDKKLPEKMKSETTLLLEKIKKLKK